MKYNKDFFYYFSLLGQLGLVFIMNILIFIYAYKIYQKYFGANTFVFFICLFVGIFSAFYNSYKLIMKK